MIQLQYEKGKQRLEEESALRRAFLLGEINEQQFKGRWQRLKDLTAAIHAQNEREARGVQGLPAMRTS